MPHATFAYRAYARLALALVLGPASRLLPPASCLLPQTPSDIVFRLRRQQVCNWFNYTIPSIAIDSSWSYSIRFSTPSNLFGSPRPPCPARPSRQWQCNCIAKALIIIWLLWDTWVKYIDIDRWYFLLNRKPNYSKQLDAWKQNRLWLFLKQQGIYMWLFLFNLYLHDTWLKTII